VEKHIVEKFNKSREPKTHFMNQQQHSQRHKSYYHLTRPYRIYAHPFVCRTSLVVGCRVKYMPELFRGPPIFSSQPSNIIWSIFFMIIMRTLVKYAPIFFISSYDVCVCGCVVLGQNDMVSCWEKRFFCCSVKYFSHKNDSGWRTKL
jgi:hypothetical protein